MSQDQQVKESVSAKALKGCGKEGRILSVGATIAAAKVSELSGIDLGPQEISVLGLSLFALAQRLETHLSQEG
mgnify:CR=1 FL=1